MNKKVLYSIIPLQILLYLLVIPVSQSIRNTPELAFTDSVFFIIPLILSAICAIQAILLAKNSHIKFCIVIYFILEYFKMALSVASGIFIVNYLLFLPFFVIFGLNRFLAYFSIFQRNRYIQKSMHPPFLYIRIIVGGILFTLYLVVYTHYIIMQFMKFYNFYQDLGSSSPISYFLLGGFAHPRFATNALAAGMIFLSVFVLLLVYFNGEKKLTASVSRESIS